jgi:mevalonate kinase
MDGATALALPTKLGQKLSVKKARGADLLWQSVDHKGDVWFDAQISLYDFKPIKCSDENIAKGITEILKNAVRLNSEFLSKWNGFKVETQLEFPINWGLGSSSSLIHNVAEWADVNPFYLQFKVANGSGYDIACAGADGPVLYSLMEDNIQYSECDYDPAYKKNIYFVYLGQKADSKDAIEFYNKSVKNKKQTAIKISQITNKIYKSTKLSEFDLKVIGDLLNLLEHGEVILF